VRIGLADDSQVFRDSLSALLQASGAEVVLQVGTGRELIEQAPEAELDVVVVDIRMPPTFTEEGLDAADQLRLNQPGLAVLVLSTYAETTYAMRVFRNGSAGRGYLLKDGAAHPSALRDALNRLNTGGSVLDSSIVDRLMTGSRRREVLGELTARQRIILAMVAQGCSNDVIAGVIHVDPVQPEIDDVLKTLGIELADPPNRLLSVVSWLRR
jgi:DNA-binding NarL/FixJ family response regulator